MNVVCSVCGRGLELSGQFYLGVLVGISVGLPLAMLLMYLYEKVC